MAPPSQGYVTFDTHPTAASIGLGSQISGQSMSLPLASGPSLALQFSIPTDGTPEMQYQHLLGLAQHLQGLALSVRPLVIPEVPLQPFLQFQCFPTAPLPLPSPQLLIAPTMGASSLPPVQPLHTAQHFTPSSGVQPLGMTGTQHSLGLQSGTVPLQQLLFLHSSPIIAQHSAFPHSMHQ